MSRLIDADPLLDKAWDVDTKTDYVRVVEVGDILHAPTVDAVPVVRCENCKHYTKSFKIHCLGKCSMHNRASQYHDYCSWAERRKDETIDAVQVVRCKDCRWGKEKCGNIECDVDMNVPPEYHGYDWFCPNGEKRNE